MYKKLLGQTAIYGTSIVLIKLLPFFLTPILTRLFNAEEYSIYADFYSVAGIIAVFLTHGMETTYFRFSVKYKKQKNKIYSTAFFSILCITFLTVFFGFIFRQEIATLFRYPKNPEFVTWFICILSLDAICALPFARLRQEEKAFKYGLIRLINSIVNFTVLIFFLILIPIAIENDYIWVDWLENIYNPSLGIAYAFLSNLIASAFTLLLLSKSLFKGLCMPNIFIWKEMIWFAFPILLVGVGGVINESLNRQFIKYILPVDRSAYFLGIFSACYKIALIISIFRIAYHLGIEPFFFTHSEKKDSKNTYSNLMSYLVLFLSCLLLFILANIQWIKWYISEEFWAGLVIVPLILIGQVFFAIYQSLSIWYKLTDKTIYGAYITILGVIVSISLNIFLIPIFGIIGAAWTTCITYFVMMTISFFLGQKLYFIPYRWKKDGFYLILSISLGLVSFYLLDSNIIVSNIFLILFISILLWREKNKILLLLKSK